MMSNAVKYGKIKTHKKNHNMWFSIQLSYTLPQYIDNCQIKKSIYSVFFIKK